MPGYHHVSDSVVKRLMPTHNPDWRDRAQAWHDFIDQGGCDRVREFIRQKNYVGLDEDDILQETLIMAYLKVEAGEYEDRSLPFSAFLKRIAGFKVLEAVRKWQGQRAAPLDAFDEVLGELPAEHERVEWYRENLTITRALSAMPARRRQVVVLDHQGYSTAEIAERLQITEVLVRKEKSVAMRALREALWAAADAGQPIPVATSGLPESALKAS